jgi:pilus assembly protein Flp/PilA
MLKFLKLIKNEKGATAIEYGLIAALIAVAAIGAMSSVGSKLGTTFNNVSNALDTGLSSVLRRNGGVERRRRLRIRQSFRG